MPKPISSRVFIPMAIRNRAYLAGVVLLAACSEPIIPDYNNATEDQFAVIRTEAQLQQLATGVLDRKSTRLNSSHG